MPRDGMVNMCDRLTEELEHHAFKAEQKIVPVCRIKRYF